MRALVALGIAACTPHGVPTPVGHAHEGVSISLYDDGKKAYSVVDDRRWVTVADHTVVLDRIDPGATLASLVIEPLAEPALKIGACERDRIPRESPEPPKGSDAIEPPEVDRYTPAVRCGVIGAPGRYLVRVLYMSPLAYRARHDIEVVAPDRATVSTRFAVATPSWNQRAELVLYDGVPGGERTPREVARGTTTLDGSTAVLVIPARDVRGQLRRIYDGAVRGSDLPATDAMWGRDSTAAVWLWLELQDLRLAPGPVHVHVELADEGVHDVDVPTTSRDQADAMLRLPLWTDEQLHGMRQRFPDYGEGAALAERFLLGVANLGEIPREVWIEEHVRPAARRRVERAWPAKPQAVGELLRNKVIIRPGAVERVGYTLAYDF